MNLSREEREEFRALSKEIFNSPSKWQKFYNNGLKELIQRTVIENIPGENGAPDTQIESKVPVLTPTGVKQYQVKYFTTESFREWLLGIKAQREEFLAAIKKQQEDEKARLASEEAAKKVQEDLGGSAI